MPFYKGFFMRETSDDVSLLKVAYSMATWKVSRKPSLNISMKPGKIP